MKDFLIWLKSAAIRAAKTFAQTAAAGITVGALISDIDWRALLSAAAVAALYSLLMNIGGLPEVELKKQLGAIRTGYCVDEPEIYGEEE